MQSDLLWASLVKELYDKVEEQLGKEVVREHRASIALSNELPSDSPETKRQKRQCAMRQRRVAASLSTACGFISAIGLYFAFEQLLRVFMCPAAPDAINAVAKFCNCTWGVNGSEAAGGCLPPLLADAPLQTIWSMLPSGLAALGPILHWIYTHYKLVKPYLDRSRGDVLFEEAKKTSGRADMTESLGFMGKVKTEVEYLYDLLNTEHYHDKDLGCKRPLRLCVMIDDLDRCPKDAIVKVLEAVILLLVNAPITCWLAIDSRVVVAAIEDHFGVRHTRPTYVSMSYPPYILSMHERGHFLIHSAASQRAPALITPSANLSQIPYPSYLCCAAGRLPQHGHQWLRVSRQDRPDTLLPAQP